MRPIPDSRPSTPFRVHLVSHTHWDREWYQPLARFRQRLVALVDELLDDPPSPGTSFLLDGQGIVIEDYLAVRPERRAELSVLLREGRLEAGPWYVLADELIPGAEALVRNLLAGRRTLRALRAAPPPVLYCPDSFGHPAALPMLAQGFGLDAVVLWRGYGGARWPAGDAAWWLGPDGSRVLLLHLPPDGYEFGSNLPSTPGDSAERWAQMRDVLAPRARLGVLLVQNGADHHARQLAHREAADALAAVAQPDVVMPSSLSAYVDDALRAARAADLPEVSGELRDSYGYTWTLQGTFGTRAAQKRLNAHVERALVRDAEPWVALARARTGRSRRALVDTAWRTLLECHPHDTLCGCSIDAVARAAAVRWEEAAAQAAGLREDALHDALGHDPAVARTRAGAWSPIAVVRNAAARPRDGLAHLEIDSFLAHVGVGPGATKDGIEVPHVLPPVPLEGRYQVLRERILHARIESPRHYPDDDLVVRRDVLLPVGLVPGYGVRAIPLDGSPHRVTDPGAMPAEVTLQGRRMSNGMLAVTVDERGAVRIEGDGRTLDDVLAVECHRDVGDLYTPSLRPCLVDPVVLSTRVLYSGPWRAATVVSWEIPGAPGAEPSRVRIVVSLDAGEPFVRFHVAGNHRGADQRIRLVIRTGVADAAVWADACFGQVERRPVAVSAADARRETPLPTAPLHRYVSLFAPGGGATVYSDGLAEYEASPDGCVAITLVRAVGELSRHDLPERPGHAGWPSHTPAGQCRGPFEAALALRLHGGARDAATIDAVERTADDVLLPLVGDTLRSALACPDDVIGGSLEGEGLAFSALKESEDGTAIVARCVNLLDVPVRGAWHFGWDVAIAQRARLDETPLGPLEVQDARAVVFTAGPREVVTIIVRPAG